MDAKFVPLGGGDPIPLLKRKILIGRRPDCDIQLGFSNVSGRHCELRYKDGVWYVRDLGSSNGVKVNGTKVEKMRLLPGDEVAIARKHLYRIEYDMPRELRKKLEKTGRPQEEDIFAKSLLERAGLAASQPTEDFDSDLWKDDVHDSDDDEPKAKRWNLE